MPSIRCKCGELLRFGEIPNPIEWLLVRDTVFDKYQGTVDAEEIYRTMISALQCPKCGRLWVFWDGFGESPGEYLPVDYGGGPERR